MPDRRNDGARLAALGVGPEDSVDGRLLTAEEVAELLGMTPAWVYEQSRAGRIPTVTLGRYRRYRRAAIVAWLEELERGTGPATAGGANPPGEAA